MEYKTCPFKQTRTLCQTADCALRINGNCAFVDIAVSLAEITASMKNADTNIDCIADTLQEVNGELENVVSAVKGLV